MHIYLKHPRHGTKVAVAEAEAVYDEKSGWVRFDPTAAPPPPPGGDNEMNPRRRRRDVTQESGL
jgi:hypothetical protein